MTHLQGSPHGLRLALAEAIRVSASQAELVRLVESVTESELLGEPRPTWHPYGFLVFRLGTGGNGETIRLHLWPRGHRHMQRPVWPIHSHPWDLQSRVICGRLRVAEFSVVEVNEGSAHRLYRVQYAEGQSILRATEVLVAVHEARRFVQVEGQGSELCVGAYHSVEADDNELAATVVLTRDNPRGVPMVVGDAEGAVEYVFPRTAYEDDATKLLEQVNRTLRQ